MSLFAAAIIGAIGVALIVAGFHQSGPQLLKTLFTKVSPGSSSSTSPGSSPGGAAGGGSPHRTVTT